MSHEIYQNDKVIIASSDLRDRGWHRLGTPIRQGMTAVEAFVEHGIDWGTYLAPIYRKIPIVDVSGFPILGDDGEPAFEWVQLESNFMHCCADNHQELGLVSDTYKKFDNMDIARFADQLAGQDAAVTVETAGTLYNRRRVFVLVKLPQVVKATSEDVSELYLLVSSGHGGFAGFSVYPTSVRVLCANTLRWSLRDAAKGLSFRHSGNLEEKLAQVRQVLGIASEETKKFQEMVSALVATTLLGDKLDTFLSDAYHLAFGSFKGLEDESLAKAQQKKDLVIAEQKALLENEKNSVDGIRGTAWAALNAVTEYHDHVRGRTAEGSQVRQHSNLFGVSSVAKTKTLSHALSLV